MRRLRAIFRTVKILTGATAATVGVAAATAAYSLAVRRRTATAVKSCSSPEAHAASV